MPTLRHSDHDLNEYQDEREQDREISLGMGTILGLFFGLALICALFFGFGYSMGRRSSPPATVASTDSAPVSMTTGGSKPSPGSPLKAVEGFFGKKQATPAADTDASSTPESSNSSTPENQPETVDQPQQAAQPAAKPHASAANPTSASVTQDISGSPARAGRNAPPAPTPAISPNGTAMVQVAAVSHQEDADLLLSALKRRGYAVFVRQEPQDHLLHIQVGPFANKKDAEAMRQKLLADGYNAILK